MQEEKPGQDKGELEYWILRQLRYLTISLQIASSKQCMQITYMLSAGNILNNYKTLLKDNFYWENQILLRRYFNNMNFLSGYETILKNASVENLKLYLKNILSNKNLMEVVMRPKN